MKLTFGRESSEEESRKIIDKFLASGGNFLDTANAYADGASEQILGRALKHHRRDNLVIATKGGLVRPAVSQWVPDGRPEHLHEVVHGAFEVALVRRR